MNDSYITEVSHHVPNWENLDFLSVSKLIDSLKTLSTKLYPKYIEEENAKYVKNKKARELAKKDFYNVTAPLIIDWIKINLKPGDCIKLEGCRDSGYREVAEIDLKQNTITSWQLRYLRKGIKFVKTGITTSNSFFKIKKILINNTWVNIKELI